MKRKALKAAILIVIGIFIASGLLFAFPQILFSCEIRHGNFVVYSTEKIHSDIHFILDSVTRNLKTSVFYQPDLHQEIYFCNDRWLYSCICFPSGKTFAGNFMKRVFVARADVSGNRAYRQMDHKTRTLVNLITHETVHTLIIDEIGFYRDMNLPTWQKEGYCDYIARGSTPSFAEGISELCAGTNQRSYFPYQLGVKYLIDEQRIPQRDLLTKKFNYDEIIARLKQRHCVDAMCRDWIKNPYHHHPAGCSDSCSFCSADLHCPGSCRSGS